MNLSIMPGPCTNPEAKTRGLLMVGEKVSLSVVTHFHLKQNSGGALLFLSLKKKKKNETELGCCDKRTSYLGV